MKQVAAAESIFHNFLNLQVLRAAGWVAGQAGKFQDHSCIHPGCATLAPP
jgi:hypothetical protein